MTRPNGLAIVGYGLTSVGFLQVAVTIAPRVADSIPGTGLAHMAIGVAVALSVDIVWAALMHTTLQTYRNGQVKPAIGFGAATLAAVLASTVLLASVGHMGPWSIVPVLAALLLVADGIREHVSVSPETASLIREMKSRTRDAYALARAQTASDSLAAVTETETALSQGRAKIARKIAESRIIGEMRINRIEAEAEIANAIEQAESEHGEAATRFSRILAGQQEILTVEQIPNEDTENARETTPAEPPARSLTVIRNGENLSETDRQILAMMRENMKAPEIAQRLSLGTSTVYRKMSQLRSA